MCLLLFAPRCEAFSIMRERCHLMSVLQHQFPANCPWWWGHCWEQHGHLLWGSAAVLGPCFCHHYFACWSILPLRPWCDKIGLYLDTFLLHLSLKIDRKSLWGDSGICVCCQQMPDSIRHSPAREERNRYQPRNKDGGWPSPSPDFLVWMRMKCSCFEPCCECVRIWLASLTNSVYTGYV